MFNRFAAAAITCVGLLFATTSNCQDTPYCTSVSITDPLNNGDAFPNTITGTYGPAPPMGAPLTVTITEEPNGLAMAFAILGGAMAPGVCPSLTA
jgi:hypothetical protein